MNQILALHRDHDLSLPADLHFRNALVAFAADQIQTAIESLNKYLLVAGRHGTFYRDALALLDAAELQRSPPIFDTTPFRDENRIFYNTGNDIFGTSERTQHLPLSQCVYPELFLAFDLPVVPTAAECYAADILLEGTDAIALEAQIVGDVAFGPQLEYVLSPPPLNKAAVTVGSIGRGNPMAPCDSTSA